jgi:4-alpha-glucanotransferase
MTVQLEDLLAAIEQVNVPGTVTEYPNWQRKLALALEDYDTDPRIEATLRMLTRLRPRATD